MPLAHPEVEGEQLTVTPEPEARPRTFAGLVETVGARLSEHIKVRRHEAPIEALPDAQTELHLHQLLRLRLEAARLALLRDDGDVYDTQLDGALALIDAYYTEEASGSLREMVVGLKGVELRPPLPDISRSYTLLRRLARAAPEAEAGTQQP
jgi:uroporphyrin-3 C-methyltransferase